MDSYRKIYFGILLGTLVLVWGLGKWLPLTLPQTPNQIHAYVPFTYTDKSGGYIFTCFSSKSGTLFPPLMH